MNTSKVRIKVFPGAQNLPLYICHERGLFENFGIHVDLLFTQNSGEIRNGLASHEFDLAHTAVDNAVAMVLLEQHDVLIIAGGDNGLNELFVQPYVKAVADLAGKTVIVDAPHTAYALQLKMVLAEAGLAAGRDYTLQPVGATYKRLQAMRDNENYAASILNPPFSIKAAGHGLKSLGRLVDMIGSYQATSVFGMRNWLEANMSTVSRYLAAYVAGVRQVFRADLEKDNVDLLCRKLDIDDETARATLRALIDPVYGIAQDAKFNNEAFATVLRLRETLEPGAVPPDFSNTRLDATYYRDALAILDSHC
ncbi:ABC transporter substrate-binding protein [Paraburkholderia nemoris]|uniref:ABC transporter substrate-binding protein n=1 Tax=Paraburkholderia nemoris TaxID=2793076 RepID=UPI0038B7CFA4